MLCALFQSHLLLAAPKSESSIFEIFAIISLNDVQIEKADNGKGNAYQLTQSGLKPNVK